MTNTLDAHLPLWQLTTATWPNSSAAALDFYKQYNVSVAALILEKTTTDISHCFSQPNQSKFSQTTVVKKLADNLRSKYKQTNMMDFIN